MCGSCIDTGHILNQKGKLLTVKYISSAGQIILIQVIYTQTMVYTIFFIDSGVNIKMIPSKMQTPFPYSNS